MNSDVFRIISKVFLIELMENGENAFSTDKSFASYQYRVPRKSYVANGIEANLPAICISNGWFRIYFRSQWWRHMCMKYNPCVHLFSYGIPATARVYRDDDDDAYSLIRSGSVSDSVATCCADYYNVDIFRKIIHSHRIRVPKSWACETYHIPYTA